MNDNKALLWISDVQRLLFLKESGSFFGGLVGAEVFGEAVTRLLGRSLLSHAFDPPAPVDVQAFRALQSDVK